MSTNPHNLIAGLNQNSLGPITHAAAQLTGIRDGKTGTLFLASSFKGADLITRIDSTPTAKTYLPEATHG
jgi:hypothetical protein